MNEATREENRDLASLGANVDTETRSQRISSFPMDPKDLGMYTVACSTGNIAATLAANSTLLSLRWTSSTARMLLEYISVWMVINGAITTSVLATVDLYVARSFTASDSGGTAISLTGDNQKRRTNMASSSVADMRVATTTGLTVGTRTLDSLPIGRIASSTGTLSGTVGFTGAAIYSVQVPDQYPLVLAANEGIVIRNLTAGPADGTLNFHFNLAWAETDIY